MTTNTAELLNCPFCGSEARSDNGFSPCESITFAWCSNNQCALHNVEIGFTPEDWNRRSAAHGEPQSASLISEGSNQAGSAEQVSERIKTWQERYKEARTNFNGPRVPASMVDECKDAEISDLRAALSAPERKAMTDDQILALLGKLAKRPGGYTMIEFAREILNQQGEQTAPEGWRCADCGGYVLERIPNDAAPSTAQTLPIGKTDAE